MTAETGQHYRIHLDVYEGPLDLLLHLVKKHELSIMDIPVAFITEKYLEYLELMRKLNLEVAGEYLLMAATLVQIKSHELLPTPDPEQLEGDDDEETLDPRQELIRRLLTYQKYKEAGAALGARPVVGRNVWTRGMPLEDVLPEDVDLEADRPLKEVPVHRLVEALHDVLRKARLRLSHDVVVDRLTINDKINELVDRLHREATFTFQSCFAFVSSGEMTAPELRHHVVVTFMAILEMARLNLLRIAQEDAGKDIYLTRRVSPDELRTPQTVSESAESETGPDA